MDFALLSLHRFRVCGAPRTFVALLWTKATLVLEAGGRGFHEQVDWMSRLWSGMAATDFRSGVKADRMIIFTFPGNPPLCLLPDGSGVFHSM